MNTSVYNQGVASLPRRFQEGGTVRATPSYQDRSKEIALLQQELDTFESQMPEGYYERNDNLRNLRTKRIDSINRRIAEAQRIQATPIQGETRYELVGPEGEVLGRYKSENSALIAAGRPPELGARGVETAGDFQTAREFRSVADQRLKEAGLGFQERGTLMGTLDSLAPAGFQPNYQAISQSSDPIAAARQASRQLIEAGAYDQAPGVSSVSSLTTRAPVGESGDLLQLVSNLSSERLGPTAELIGVTPGGNMLGNMGATADQIRNRLLNFGQGLTQENIDALKQQMVEKYGEEVTSGFGAGGGIYSALSELSPFDAPTVDPDQQYFYSFDQAVMDPLSPQNTAATTAPEITPPPAPSTAVTQTTQSPTYGQQQQPGAQQPIAPPIQAVTTPTGIQTPSGILGTSSSPLQTAGLSAVPDTTTTLPNYTGTTMANLTIPSQGQQTIQSVMYNNDTGQTVVVTEVNGQPTTYVPPGFKKSPGQGQTPQQQTKEAPIAGVMPSPQTLAEGGTVGEDRTVDAMYRMASQFLGYKGPKTRKGLEEFAKSSPGAASKMKAYTSAMAKGGLIKGYAPGGMVTPTMQNAQIPTPTPTSGQIQQDQLADMSGNLMRQTLQPIQAPTSFIQPQEADFIAPTAGMTVPQAPFAESATVGNVEQANLPQVMTPATFTSTMAAPAVAQETANLQAAQGQVSQGAQVQGAQQVGSAVSNLKAAQGEAIKMNNPMQREIQAGELISGSAVDATKVEALNSQMQAAEATPSSQATVQGQLEGLMTQFEGGKVPAWAAGAMRGAMAQLSARGLGASSLAGQAVVQAAMESAIPIAQVDAQTRAQFESQNLSNRQQTAMMAAQQRANFLQIEFDQDFKSRVQNSARIADIANMNFTAEQQIALENSRNANTVNLQNLGNRQAMTMAEAASLANLDMANLNNRQQAAVQNAQSFLQMDLTNLNNEQQTELFKTQQNIQSLFTDQAAENASLQFNAASENQTKQFFSNLTSQVGQFNATQRNAMDQFNVNSVNAMRQFNSEVQQQRDLFNAQNGLVIAQANAQWRQNIATLNTSAQNQSNMDFAKTINGLTAGNLDQVWQRERDIMSYSFAQSESKQDRALSILLADKDLAAYREKMAQESDDAKAAVFTRLLFGS